MLKTDLYGHLYFGLRAIAGSKTHRYLAEWLRQDHERSVPASPVHAQLSAILAHAQTMTAYHREVFRDAQITASDIETDPAGVLRRLPLLTKAVIRDRAADLTVSDITHRRWYYNTSGGSTGEPVRFIQDQDYADRVHALAMLYACRIGKRPSEPEVRIWGSERDIFGGTQSVRSRLGNHLTRTRYINAFRVTPEVVADLVRSLNANRPRLIVAYAQAIYDIARQIEREGLKVAPQSAIVTSAGTLHEFMREKISAVFGCPVYNRYGSREVGDIACERPGLQGLAVAPWGTYVEVVDSSGNPVPIDHEGEIVVTSLSNYAMPLIRYRIGDRGALRQLAEGGQFEQILKHVSGRIVDSFITSENAYVDGEYFTHLMYFRPWVKLFQVVQESRTEVRFVIVLTDVEVPEAELKEIVDKSRLVMGPEVHVEFEFVDEIPHTPSGKYRYTISRVI